MKPDPITGKSRVHADPQDVRRWRNGVGRVQLFVPMGGDFLSPECQHWLHGQHMPLDVAHDDAEDVHVGSRLTVFGQTFYVLEVTHGHPFPEVMTAWAEPWTLWRHLGG